MHNVHVDVVHQVSPVRIGLQMRVKLFHAGIQRLAQVILVHVAHRHQPAALVTGKVEAAHAYASRAYNAPRQLVAGCHKVVVSPHLSEHFPRKDGEQADAGRRLLDKASS